jgi:hypothetical protein
VLLGYPLRLGCAGFCAGSSLSPHQEEEESSSLHSASTAWSLSLA